MLKKIIETSALGLSMEAIAPFIGKAIVGYKKYRAKARAKKDDLLKTPEGHSGNIVETEIVGNLDDGFEQQIRLSQPLFDTKGKPLYVSEKEIEKGAKQPGLWGQWFGSRQGLDRLTHQTLERKINRA